MNGLIKIATSILPVVVFLVSLVVMDSFKLVRPKAILIAVAAGCGIALLSLPINTWLMEFLKWDFTTYARYGGPVIEEVLKAAYIIYLIRSRHVAFAVDAAILGFAVGTGFAIVENIYYINVCLALGPVACILRGFGTAVMHGGATALFGILALSLFERYVSTGARVILPSLGLAYVVHSAFNHLLVSPVLTVMGLVIVLPIVLVIAFKHSERTLRNWLGVGFDTDADLLAIVKSGRVSHTHIGAYLTALKESFEPTVVADMLCILRLHAELSIKAKGALLMQEAGFDVAPDPEVREMFEELQFLEKSIGKTGQIAIAPFLQWRTRDLWQQHLLGRK